MSPHPYLRLRLRVHQSPLRRARVNLHAFAPPSRSVLQIARAATMNEIARPRNVPTLWRRALITVSSDHDRDHDHDHDHDRDVDERSLASSSRELPLTIGAVSESPLAIDSMTESAMLFDAISPESPLALAVLTLDTNEGER